MFGNALIVGLLLFGCGGESIELGNFKALDSRAYLINDSMPFGKDAVIAAVEVVSSGTSQYSMRYLLPDSIQDTQSIEIDIGAPVSNTAVNVFKLKKANFSTGSNSDYWSFVSANDVQAPLVPSQQLVTQIRTAAERGHWTFKFLDGVIIKGQGSILPSDRKSVV